jgi:hypothetical protein
VTIFDLTRKRRTELIALYLSTSERWPMHGGNTDYAKWFVAGMTREQLVAAIVGTEAGARLLEVGG